MTKVMVIPALLIVVGCLWQAYNIGYYRNVKDPLYGGETLFPTLVTAALWLGYWVALGLFKLILA